VTFEERVLRHAIDVHGLDLIGNAKLVFRMRGLGIFNDPNDIALLIGVGMVICVYFLSDRRLSVVRFVWLAPLVVLGYGYIQTESRGGLLAIGAAGMVWLAVRYGGKVAMAIGVLGILAAPLALGRAADMNVSDGSGQERIQIWGEGLAAMRSLAIATGIGEGQFYEVAGHVAHNSYIHAYVELGFFGGSLFLGCFFLPVLAIWRMKRYGLRVLDAELVRMLPYIAAIITCWAVGIATLSRCYSASTYMIVGVAAAYLNLAGYHQPRPRPIVEFNPPLARQWALCSVGVLAASFAFVKVFARWSS
jgi:O-antigen ligase